MEPPSRKRTKGPGRRIAKELVEFNKEVEAKLVAARATVPDATKEDVSEMTIETVGDDLMHLKVTFNGPMDTIWAGHAYELDVSIPGTYPIDPPKIKFVRPIFHCNVYSSGAICLDTLQSKWAGSLTIAQVTRTIMLLMQDPNKSSPANVDASSMMKTAGQWEARVKANPFI